MALIDFTECEIDLMANYGGSDKKRGIIDNGKRYMLKMSDKISEEKQNSLNSSYSNSTFSEFIGCHIMESMGFSVQRTLLGTIRMISSRGGEQVYPSVACENFVPSDKQLIEFKIIEGAILDVKPPKIPKLEHIYDIMTQPNVYFSKVFGKVAMSAYWDQFIADALLGNFDRHANNWGYLIDQNTKELTLAPIYDCGSCLYPQIADDAIERILTSKDEIQKRIDVFPQAALTLNGNKVSYKGYISSFMNEDCNNALLRVAPCIDMNKVKEIILHTDGISEIRKAFYMKMLSERYDQIIMELYMRLAQRNQRRTSSLFNARAVP